MRKNEEYQITKPAKTQRSSFCDPVEMEFSFRTYSRNSRRPRTSQEISNLSRMAERYKEEVEISDANYELNQFEVKNGTTKNIMSKPKIPIPEGIDLDMIADLDVRMKYKPKTAPQQSRPQSRSILNFSQRSELGSLNGHKMIHRCPCCNPTGDEAKETKEKRISVPRGGCHWQLLDGPELPKTTLISHNHHKSSRPFLLPARHIGQPGIQLLVDDLVEVREHNQQIFERNMEKLIQKENMRTDATLRNRVMTRMEQTSKFHSRTADLERRSGQLAAAKRLSYKPPPPKKIETKDPLDLEAIAQQCKYENEQWTDYQLHKKNDAIAQLLVQETQSSLRQKILSD